MDERAVPAPTEFEKEMHQNFCDISGVALPPRRLSPLESELLEACRHALLSLTNPSVEAQTSAIEELMRVITDAQVIQRRPPNPACFWCS